MPVLSYDLHLHPAPSTAPRWGDGRRVWEAAAEAGVRGFVWKAHEEHTARRCRQLPSEPVRAIASASLNPWARFDDVVGAVDEGALWLWGPTQTPDGQLGWELPLPAEWRAVADWLARYERPLVLATGHLGTEGRAAFAAVAAENDDLVCSITHSLLVPLAEALELAARGCVFEVDAFTYAFPPSGRRPREVAKQTEALLEVGALVYFTSDGGQAHTGNPFDFGARVLDELGEAIGADAAVALGVENPAALVERVGAVAAA